jgi:hypothetical protein
MRSGSGLERRRGGDHRDVKKAHFSCFLGCHQQINRVGLTMSFQGKADIRIYVAKCRFHIAWNQKKKNAG